MNVQKELLVMLKFYAKIFLCDWQGTVRRAILYADRCCFKTITEILKAPNVEFLALRTSACLFHRGLYLTPL